MTTHSPLREKEAQIYTIYVNLTNDYTLCTNGALCVNLTNNYTLCVKGAQLLAYYVLIWPIITHFCKSFM